MQAVNTILRLQRAAIKAAKKVYKKTRNQLRVARAQVLRSIMKLKLLTNKKRLINKEINANTL